MNSKHFPTLIFISLIAVIIVQRIIMPFANSLSWDVFGYYLYLPATFIHHDPGLTDRSWIDAIIQKYQNTDFFYQAYPGIKHYWVIKYPLGLSLFYAPFFFLAHLLSGVLGYARDGFSIPYQFSLSFGMLFYTVAGLNFFKKILLKFFNGYYTALIMILIVFGTNFFHLTADSGLMPHNILFMLVAMFVWFTLKWTEEPKIKYAVYLGLISGLIIITRPNEILCLLFLLVWIALSFRSVKNKLYHVLYAVPAFLLCVLPQMIYWKITSGDFIFYSYQDPCQGFDFNEPYTLDFLFSFRKGWFVYTPLVMIMFSGMIFLFKKHKPLFYSVMAYFVISVYVASSWSCWWYAGCCYSQRAVMSLYVVLALPLGFLLEWMFRQRWFIKIPFIIILVLMVTLNLFQMWQFNHGIIKSDLITKEYYCKIFGKTKLNNDYLNLLLPEPRINEDTVTKDFTALPKTSYGTDAFCKSKLFKEEKWIRKSDLATGPYYVVDSNVEFSPAIDISYTTIKNYSWAKVSVDLYFPEQVIKNCPFLVITSLHKGDNCKYYTYRLAKDSVAFNTWISIEKLYLTPEVRSKKDIFSVFLWNPEKAQFYIRRLKVDFYDFK
jgi:hypothetical protein